MVKSNRLCAVKGCQNPAAYVPFFRAYAAMHHGPERAATSTPISDLSHCADCRKKHTKLSDLLGGEYLQKIAAMFTSAGKRRPVRFELDWVPVS